MGRSNSGCITCRIRRVKCDETRPVCQKCTTSRRTCDGYLDATHHVSRRRLATLVRDLAVVGPVAGPVSRALMPSPPSLQPSSSLERVAADRDALFFDLFRQVTVPSTCGLFPSSFWQVDVLQLAHGEPAIWHATVALGLLHKISEDDHSDNNGEIAALHRRAVQHYGRAMALANGLDGPVKLATLSIALVAIASMLERYGELQMHVLAGLKLVAAADDENGNRNQNSNDNNRLPPRHTAITRSLEGALMRADMQAMTFSDSSSPYPWGDSASVYAADRYLAMPIAHESQMSYSDLASELFGLSRTYLLLEDGFLMGDLTYGPWMTRMDGFSRKLKRWEERMAELDARVANHDQDTSTVIAKLSLRLYHALLKTLVRAESLGPETRFDHLLGIFEYIFRVASTLQSILVQQQPSTRASREGRLFGLSLEPGLIIPLWVVAHRCRHGRLRRATARLLRGMNRVEGTWRSDATAKVVETVLALEEGSSTAINLEGSDLPVLDASWFDDNVPWSIWSRSDMEIPLTLSWADVPPVPEERRIKDVLVHFSYVERRVNLRFLMTPTDDGEPYGPAKDVVVLL